MKYKFLRVLFSIIFIFLINGISFGQGICDVKTFNVNKLIGKVIADGPKGEEPVEKAKIELRKVNKSNTLIRVVLTDVDGNFEVGKIKPGEYSITVSKKEWRILDYLVVVNVSKKKSEVGIKGILLIRLGFDLLKPCGGGGVKLLED